MTVDELLGQNVEEFVHALRFVAHDIDLILSDYFSGLPEDHVKATPAYNRLTSLLYLDRDCEQIASPAAIVERAKAYGSGPLPLSDIEVCNALMTEEERSNI